MIVAVRESFRSNAQIEEKVLSKSESTTRENAHFPKMILLLYGLLSKKIIISTKETHDGKMKMLLAILHFS